MIVSAARIYVDGVVKKDVALELGPDGRVKGLVPRVQAKLDLGERLLVPGAVNAHSHAFQRLLRGRTQAASSTDDNFWSWREIMYRAAGTLDPEGIRTASRQAFLEMALSGITTVGEFHYLHHAPDGTPYSDPLATARALIAAAGDVGIRLCLIRTIYLRGDFDTPPSELQRRFCDPSLDAACAAIDELVKLETPMVSVAVAAHSVRAVAIGDIRAAKERYRGRSFHLHVSEQPREVEQCLAKTGKAPVALLAQAGVLDKDTTLVHATHLRDGEVSAIAQSGATVCICPSTEADLGDGLGPVRALFDAGVPMALGTDGQTLLSLLEEGRRLEMHARLQHQRRNVVTRAGGDSSAKACFDSMTVHGARALGIDAGRFAPGSIGDFVTYDLRDPALVGCDDDSLLAALVFSTDSRAVRDVCVGGRLIVRDGKYTRISEHSDAYVKLTRQLFG
ncbi:MAG: formimidoylglutamate deiminase [Myxococcota bacterium]